MSRPASSAVGHRVRGQGLMAVRETPVSLVFDCLCVSFLFFVSCGGVGSVEGLLKTIHVDIT